MDFNRKFTMWPAETKWRDRVRNFMNDVVRPHDETYAAQQARGERWKTLPIIEELKERAKADGIWNLFMPQMAGHNPVDGSFEFVHPGLTNLAYAKRQSGELGKGVSGCGDMGDG